jgi:hypothetical protein
VSPSITLAFPNKSSDNAAPHEAARTSPTSGPFALVGSRWCRAIDAPQTQCCTALVAVGSRFRSPVLQNIVDSVVSSQGAEVSGLTQEKLLNYLQLLASTGIGGRRPNNGNKS